MCPVGFVAMNGDCFATTVGAPAETAATSFEAAQNRGASGQGVHRHLAATGDDYAWYTAGHLMFGAALMVPPENPGPSVLFGGSIEGNIPFTALINRPGFALHLGLDLVGRIVGGSNNGLQLYQVPQMAGGLNLGFATDSGWLHLHAGGGFAVNLSATTAGGARAAVVPLGDVGLRFGVHVSHHSINRFDILSICGSGSLLFGEGDGVLPVFAVGVCL
jgi:hypothetical protein